MIEEDIHVQLVKNDPLKDKDACGFPISLFTQGSYFDPYLSIQSIDSISKVKSCVLGATNALFAMKKDLFDVIVKIEDDGNLVHNHIEFVNDAGLERIIALTSADLRFADFVLKKVEEQMKSSTAEFDGSDEWIRLQMKNYLLGLVSTSRSNLQAAIPHFGVPFVNEWRRTKNHVIWMSIQHEDLVSVPPGHMFSEQMGVYDVYLKFEHAVNGVEGASKVFGSVNTAGKNLGTSIGKFALIDCLIERNALFQERLEVVSKRSSQIGGKEKEDPRKVLSKGKSRLDHEIMLLFSNFNFKCFSFAILNVRDLSFLIASNPKNLIVSKNVFTLLLLDL